MTQWIELIGYAASVAVFATFCVKEMFPLRCLAIMSNVLFMAYGFFEHLPPVLLLHAVLLPTNVVRLAQLRHPGLLRKTGMIFREGQRR
jgi:CRP/FNR family cyclic AMP-dependent transcriptional regulator